MTTIIIAFFVLTDRTKSIAPIAYGHSMKTFHLNTLQCRIDLPKDTLSIVDYYNVVSLTIVLIDTFGSDKIGYKLKLVWNRWDGPLHTKLTTS